MGLTAALGEWRSSMMVSGGKFVIITGAMKRLQRCVRNWTAELRKNSQKISTLVTVDWGGMPVDVLAMWALSLNANFKKSQGRVKGFLFHVQVRHKSRNMLLWECLLPKVLEGSVDSVTIFYIFVIIYKSRASFLYGHLAQSPLVVTEDLTLTLNSITV